VKDGTTFTFKADIASVLAKYNIVFNTNRYLYAANTAGGTCAANAGQNLTSSNINDGYRFTLEKVDALDVTIGEAQYATFYAPVSVTLPDGLSAYTGVVDGDYLRLTAVSDNTIPAHTGVILQDNAATYRLPIVSGSYQAATAVDEEDTTDEGITTLSGTVATINAETPTSGAIYTLQKPTTAPMTAPTLPPRRRPSSRASRPTSRSTRRRLPPCAASSSAKTPPSPPSTP
jgi:hypothetical protein